MMFWPRVSQNDLATVQFPGPYGPVYFPEEAGICKITSAFNNSILWVLREELCSSSLQIANIFSTNPIWILYIHLSPPSSSELRKGKILCNCRIQRNLTQNFLVNTNNLVLWLPQHFTYRLKMNYLLTTSVTTIWHKHTFRGTEECPEYPTHEVIPLSTGVHLNAVCSRVLVRFTWCKLLVAQRVPVKPSPFKFLCVIAQTYSRFTFEERKDRIGHNPI